MNMQQSTGCELIKVPINDRAIIINDTRLALKGFSEYAKCLINTTCHQFALGTDFSSHVYFQGRWFQQNPAENDESYFFSHA